MPPTAVNVRDLLFDCVGAELILYHDQLMADIVLWLTAGKASLEKELHYI